MILATEIFRSSPGQRLDFTRGAVDVVDLFNNGILPSVNAWTETAGMDSAMDESDPFVEQADQDANRSRDFLDALSSGYSDSGSFLPSRLGFEVAVGTNDASPRSGRHADSPPPLQTTPQEAKSVPEIVNNAEFDPAAFTFEREARRDRQGRLRVYNPPSGDGGGSFEVAGITARYQPNESRRLRALIAEGKTDQAESEAKDFYRRRAAPFVRYAKQPGVQLQLADSVHHRGEGGLRKMLQRATGTNLRDDESLIRRLDADPEALEKFNQARIDYELEEVDRGRSSRRKFRKGLLNRFKEANEAAVAANERK